MPLLACRRSRPPSKPLHPHIYYKTALQSYLHSLYMEKNHEKLISYGEERLLSYLNKSSNANNPRDLIEDISKTIVDFVGDAEQSDDITMLGLTYWGPSGET